MSSSTKAHSVVEPSPATRSIAGIIVLVYVVVTLIPLVWIVMTSFKSPPDSISYPPKVVFEPTLEGYCNLFTTRSRQTQDYIDALPPADDLCERIARGRNMVVVSPSNYAPRFVNSLVIAFGSTLVFHCYRIRNVERRSSIGPVQHVGF